MASNDREFQPNPSKRDDDSAVKRADGGAAAGKGHLQEFLQQPRGPGRSIPASLVKMQGQLGDLSEVRIHDDPQSAAMVRAMGAQGFTYGKNIFLAEGASEDVIAHEVAHAAQHRGAAPTGEAQVGGSSAHEEYADRAAAARHVPGGMDVDVPHEAPRVRFKDAGGVDVVSVIAKEMGTDEGKAKQMLRNANAEGRGTVETAVRRNFGEEKGKELITAVPAGGGEHVPEVKGKEQAAPKKGAEGKEGKGKPGAKDAHGKEGEPGGKKGEHGGEHGGGAHGGEHAEGGGVAETVGEFQGMSTEELNLIHQELIEHEEWQSSSALVGGKGSDVRAGFIAEQAGKGTVTGFTSGVLLGGATGLVTKLAERFCPIPGVGAIIAGGMSAYGLATKDWKESGETISKFGQGSDTYEMLANTIASVSGVIDIIVNVLNVIAGVIGIISAAMWIITICTLGAASPLAATLSAIALGIVAASSAIDEMNKLCLQPLVMLFRAMHTFQSDADPRDVEKQGVGIGKAAEGAASILGAKVGAKAGEKLGGIGAKPHAEHGGGEGGEGGDPGSGKHKGGGEEQHVETKGKGDEHGETKADEHNNKADEHKADEHKADEHKADEHKADEHKTADEHKGDEHKQGEEKKGEGEEHKKAEAEKKTAAERKAQAQEKIKEAAEAKKKAYEELKAQNAENAKLKRELAEERGPAAEEAASKAKKAEAKKIEAERVEANKKADAELDQKLKDIEAQGKKSAEELQKAEFERDMAAKQAAHEQRLADMKAAADTQKAEMEAAGKRTVDEMDANRKEWEANSKSPELDTKLRIIEQAHEAANKSIEKIEDPKIREQVQNDENMDFANKKLENAQQQKAHADEAGRRWKEADAAAKKRMDDDFRAAAAAKDAAMAKAEAEYNGKVKASEETTAKAKAEHDAMVAAEKGEAQSEAKSEKTAANDKAAGKKGDVDAAGEKAAAAKRAELDAKWAKAKKEGREKSKEYTEAAKELDEARAGKDSRYFGDKKRVGEADFGGVRDNVLNPMREGLFGKEYGKAEGPEIEEKKEGAEHGEEHGEKKEAAPEGETHGEKKEEHAGLTGIPARLSGGYEEQEHESGYGKGKADRFQIVGEKKSPKYTNPPGDPKQLEAMKEKIIEDMAVRAKAEADENAMQLAEAKAKGDAPRIAELEKAAKGGTQASKAHEDAVKRKAAANKAQGERREQGESSLKNNATRVAGVSALSVPLAAFAGFTWIGAKVGIPGFQKMNDDAVKFGGALLKMKNALTHGDAETSAAKGGITADGSKIAATGAHGAQNSAKLTQNEGKVGELKGHNDQKVQEAGTAKNEAKTVKGARAASAAKGKSEYAQLAGSLKGWATQHKEQRLESEHANEEEKAKPAGGGFGSDLPDPVDTSKMGDFPNVPNNVA